MMSCVSTVSLTKSMPLLASQVVSTMVTPEKGATSVSGASEKAMTSITDALTIRKTTPTAQNGRLCSGRCSSTFVECLRSIRPTALQQQPTNTRTMPMIQSSMLHWRRVSIGQGRVPLARSARRWRGTGGKQRPAASRAYR